MPKPDAYEPGLRARHPAVCVRCDRNIRVGDRIAYQRGSYIHVECANGADDE